MAEAAIIQRNGETLLGAKMWRPRQGNTVVLSRKLPARSAIMPTGPTLELGRKSWSGHVHGRVELNGDAFNTVIREKPPGYILYVRGNEGDPLMTISDSQADVMTVQEEGGLDAMSYKAAGQRVIAAMASQLVLEAWRLAKITDDEPVFLEPGLPLRDKALEDADVLLDAAKDGGCWDYLAGHTSEDYGVIESWLVPLGDQKHMRHRLRFFRWFVQMALHGGKPKGRKGGRLPRQLEVPSWTQLDHLAQMANEYWYSLNSDKKLSSMRRDQSLKIPGMPSVRKSMINS